MSSHLTRLLQHLQFHEDAAVLAVYMIYLPLLFTWYLDSGAWQSRIWESLTRRPRTASTTEQLCDVGPSQTRELYFYEGVYA